MLDELRSAAFRAAESLAHSWIGDEHFLLALVEEWPECDAGRALRLSGVSAAALRDELGKLDAATSGAPPQLTPRAYELQGFIRGLAAGGARWEVTPEDALFALLFENNGLVPSLLDRCGTTRGEVVARMRVAGSDIPRVPLPPIDLRPWGEPVWVPPDRVLEVVTAVRGRVPEGTLIGFNWTRDRERAWVSAGEEVDLEALVAEILADA